MHMAQNKEEVVQQWLGIRQHCRLTLWTYDWWYRKSTHQRQRVSEHKIQRIILISETGSLSSGEGPQWAIVNSGVPATTNIGSCLSCVEVFLEEAPVV